MKKIINILLWPFEHLADIFFISLVFGCITLIELLILKIPDTYGEKILLGNIIISLIIYFYSKRATTREYEELLENLKSGIPTKDECIQYENELKNIHDKYSGEEAYKKAKEFIIRKRMEITLEMNGLGDSKNQ